MRDSVEYEELFIAAMLIVCGAIPVASILEHGGPWGAEATLGAMGIVAGVVSVTKRLFRLVRRAPAPTDIATARSLRRR